MAQVLIGAVIMLAVATGALAITVVALASRVVQLEQRADRHSKRLAGLESLRQRAIRRRYRTLPPGGVPLQ